MQIILNQITTYFLAFLILISTTGFSITAGWCDCIDEEYVMLFAKIACCSHEDKLIEAPNCTIADSNCCDTESAEYAHSDIDFQVNVDNEWSFDVLELSFVYIEQMLPYSSSVDLWFQNAIQLPPIKAPPTRYGKNLLVYIQTFLC